MRDHFSFAAARSDAEQRAAEILVELPSRPDCLTTSLGFADPENRCLGIAQYVAPGKQRRLSKKFCANCTDHFLVPRNRVLQLKTQTQEKRDQLERRQQAGNLQSVGNRFVVSPDNFYLLQHGDVVVRQAKLTSSHSPVFIAKDDFQGDEGDDFFSLYQTEDDNVPFFISDETIVLGRKRSGGYNKRRRE